MSSLGLAHALWLPARSSMQAARQSATLHVRVGNLACMHAWAKSRNAEAQSKKDACSVLSML
jgi:hypothetical protein